MRTSFMTAFALAGWMCCGTASAIDLAVVPSANNVQIGDFVDVDLVVSGLGDQTAPSLGGYDVNLNFNAGVLSFVSVEFGTQLDVFEAGGNIQSSFSGPGTVNLYEVSLDFADDLNTWQPGSFSLATLHFEVLAAGASALELQVTDFADAAGDGLPVDNLVNGSVTAVPEPGNALLMLLGLLPVGLAVRRARRM